MLTGLAEAWLLLLLRAACLLVPPLQAVIEGASGQRVASKVASELGMLEQQIEQQRLLQTVLDMHRPHLAQSRRWHLLRPGRGWAWALAGMLCRSRSPRDYRWAHAMYMHACCIVLVVSVIL